VVLGSQKMLPPPGLRNLLTSAIVDITHSVLTSKGRFKVK
jgi:hypothetical protein